MIRKSKKKGFTLVELVIVIAVIAILAGVMIATFSNVVEKANASKAFQEMKARVDSAYIECLTEEKDVQYIAVDGKGAVYFTSSLEEADAAYTYYSLALVKVETSDEEGATTTVAIEKGYCSLGNDLYFVVTNDGYLVVDSLPEDAEELAPVSVEPTTTTPDESSSDETTGD